MAERGIDISKYQSSVDFSQVAASGVSFVMIRAGYGMYANQKDPLFESHYAGAVRAGLAVGTYHYSYAKSTAEALQEAEVFLEWVKGKNFTYPLAIDLEDASQAGLSRDVLTQIANTFCERVAQAGYTPMVYANKNWLMNKLNTAEIPYDIWLAHYTAQTDYQGAYAIWQYTSTGKVPGVQGNCDCDWCYKAYGAAGNQNLNQANESVSSWKHGVCTADAVNVRAEPSTKSAVLRQLYSGNEVDVFSRDGGWCYVNAGGIYGYVSSQYIAIDGESNMCYQPGEYQVICSRLNVREGPATSYRIKTQQELSPSAQAQGGYQMGVIFTALETINKPFEAWARTPSGWVCLENQGGVYCKKKG